MDKIKREDILADMHTHTVFSLHAYSTLEENIQMALKHGLKYIAVTDHYYGNGDELDKKNEINRIRYVEERVNHCNLDLKVIGGCEFNLNQEVYTFDKLLGLRWRPIGLHNWFVKTAELSLNDVFELFKEGHQKGHNAFVHIERELHKVNKGRTTLDQQIEMLKRVVDYAYDNDIWLEVNESSMRYDEGGGAYRQINWLRYAKEKGNKIYLGTDAHYCREVGLFPCTLSLLNRLEYPKELILNCNETLLNELMTSKP